MLILGLLCCFPSENLLTNRYETQYLWLVYQIKLVYFILHENLNPLNVFEYTLYLKKVLKIFSIYFKWKPIVQFIFQLNWCILSFGYLSVFNPPLKIVRKVYIYSFEYKCSNNLFIVLDLISKAIFMCWWNNSSYGILA